MNRFDLSRRQRCRRRCRRRRRLRVLPIHFVSLITTSLASVLGGLITSWLDALARNTTNLYHSWHIKFASRRTRFHPDCIPEHTSISETKTGAFVRGQFCRVAASPPSAKVVLTRYLFIR